ncbi:hypothetical protein BX600DRAFT_103420 [Xylariales sp. PMI_506]|nr:hypothetical protein BX600DRAFT_103420 [Xylariales sp. PMI_506]
MLLKIFSALPLVAGALAGSVRPRSSKTDLTLYAYGSDGTAGIGGYPIAFKDDFAYITASSFNSITTNVTFDYSGGTLTATTEDGLERLLYVPSASGAVGFASADATSSSEITNEFGFYGSTVYCYIDGTISTKWFAVPTDESGLWQLSWNSTSDAAIAIALRSVAPAS